MMPNKVRKNGKKVLFEDELRRKKSNEDEIMDDDEMVREMVRKILSHLGYHVTVTADGQNAVKIYKSARSQKIPFDLVIMDLTIPGGMGGSETMKRLQEIDPNVKGIVSSGYSNDPIMANYRKYGFVGRLSKPYQIELLSSTIANILD